MVSTVSDVLDHPESPWYRGCSMVNANRVLVVALVVESRWVGVLSATNKRSGPFDNRDAELAMQIAPHLALAIDAAAKHQQLQQQQRQLDRALQVHAQLSKAIVNAPNVAPVAESLALAEVGLTCSLLVHPSWTNPVFSPSGV
jgi:GAF domain-containing protein